MVTFGATKSTAGLLISMLFLSFPAGINGQTKWWRSIFTLRTLSSTEEEVRSIYSSTTPTKKTLSHGYSLDYQFKEGYLGISFSGGCVGGKPGRDYAVEKGRVTTIYVYFYENIPLSKLGVDLKRLVMAVTPGTRGHGRTYIDDQNGVRITGDAKKASSVSIAPPARFDSMRCE